jgi:hypothetical protein
MPDIRPLAFVIALTLALSASAHAEDLTDGDAPATGADELAASLGDAVAGMLDQLGAAAMALGIGDGIHDNLGRRFYIAADGSVSPDDGSSTGGDALPDDVFAPG